MWLRQQTLRIKQCKLIIHNWLEDIVISRAAFVFYFQIRAKSNFIVDSVSFYITEVSFACCQDRIIPFHTLKWKSKMATAESWKVANARIFATN